MNRRSFIASLIATATLDPERLMWLPGAKRIFIPSVPSVAERAWVYYGRRNVWLAVDLQFYEEKLMTRHLVRATPSTYDPSIYAVKMASLDCDMAIIRQL
jgi:hypothetical protein